jgi:hypothetical protein
VSSTVTYTSGSQSIISPTQLNNRIIRLAGTTPSLPTAPLINLTGLLATYALDKVEVLGTSATPNYGWVESDPETFTTFTKGVRVSHGTLTTDANSGFTFEGKSVITNDGTLDALGGRYHSSLYTLNGSVLVGENSSADFSDVHLTGHGTVKLTAESATVSAGGIGGVGAGVHFDLTEGGTLNIDNGMNFLGHVDIGCQATVNINTPVFDTAPLGAVSEIWHARSDVLDLLGSAGQDVAHIQFARGTPKLYAAPNTTTGGVSVSTHFAVGDLPVTVVHS